MKVSAKTKDHPEPIEVDYDFAEGKGLKGLVEKFGEEVVYSRALSSLVIDLQALIRRHREKKDFDKSKLLEAVKAWKPTTVTTQRKPMVERLKDDVTKLSPEQRAELLKALQNPQAAKPSTGQPQAGKRAA